MLYKTDETAECVYLFFFLFCLSEFEEYMQRFKTACRKIPQLSKVHIMCATKILALVHCFNNNYYCHHLVHFYFPNFIYTSLSCSLFKISRKRFFVYSRLFSVIMFCRRVKLMPFYLEETIMILISILLKRLKQIRQSQTVKISHGLRVHRRSHNQNRYTFLLKVVTAHEGSSFAMIFLNRIFVGRK